MHLTVDKPDVVIIFSQFHKKDIESEIAKAQKNILELKKNSINSIHSISQEIASNIIEKMSGDKLNESSIKATVEDLAKKNIGKYL